MQHINCSKQYTAITYDVCEHLKLFEEMNTYILNPAEDFDKQIATFSQADYAPLVKVYESAGSFEEAIIYREYKFPEYKCSCEQE